VNYKCQPIALQLIYANLIRCGGEEGIIMCCLLPPPMEKSATAHSSSREFEMEDREWREVGYVNIFFSLHALLLINFVPFSDLGLLSPKLAEFFDREWIKGIGVIVLFC
jgi:hypothetical protein